MSRTRRRWTVLGWLVVASVAPFGMSNAAPTTPTDATEKRLAELESEEARAKNEVAECRGELAKLSPRISSAGRAYYKLTKAGVLSVSGGFDELVRHALRVEKVRRGLSGDVSREKKLRERFVVQSKLLEQLRLEREKLESSRAARTAERERAEEESRRSAAFSRAFDRSRSPRGDSVTLYGAVDSDDARQPRRDPSPLGFAEAKGRLLFPVVGRAEVKPGRREGTGGPGLEIAAPVGTPVRAVYAGRVAFADRYEPYGRIVILDHGRNYYTVSGNLGAVDVRTGSEVLAGERIGSVGDDGKGAMLYFEVRHGSQTIEPGPWLGM